MLWTISLISTGVLGILLAGSKNRTTRLAGWLLYALNEILWFLYGLVTSDLPLTIMACVWFVAGMVNIIRTERAANGA